MNRYEKCLEYIESLGSLDSILGLERIKKVLIYFDNPQDKLNIVHIAGTNGKGSTTMMLSNIYIKAGYNVGSYISPYVVDFRERIQYNCDFISKEDLCDLVDEIKHVIYNNNLKLTHFEFITVIAFIYFKNKNCDLVFLEVGLGGRLDATNVILKPLVSVITKIDYDHVDILGHDLVSIAKEKCGIIKNNCNTVLYFDQNIDVINTVKNKCSKLNNKLYISDITKLKILNNDVFNIEIEYDNKKYTIGLNGKYQIYNTLTVLKVVEVLNKLKFITKYQDVYYGIKNTSIAGRFEILSNKPLIIADGAHNKSGIKVFIQSIIEIKCDNKIAIVSILKDKDITSMDKLFCNNFDKIIIVPINTLRGSDIKYIENDIKQYNKNVECIFDYKEAINLAKKYANNTGMICIFGSLYLISDIRKIIL